MATLVKKKPVTVFVFGANEAGKHGGGAAAYAVEHHGAVWGQVGRQGRSFGIPTKDGDFNTLPLPVIYNYVQFFLNEARDEAVARPSTRFRVTRIGCGLAGLTDRDIAPMFKDAPSNCLLPDGWRELSEGIDLPGRMYFVRLDGQSEPYEVWAVSEDHAVSRLARKYGWHVALGTTHWVTVTTKGGVVFYAKDYITVKEA